MKLFQGIIIGWFIGSVIDYILISLDYYGVFESLIRLPRIIKTLALDTIVGRWLDTVYTLILLDRQLNKLELDEYMLNSMLGVMKIIKDEVVEKETKLILIKSMTLDNIDDIIEDIEIFKYTHYTIHEIPSEYDVDEEFNIDSDGDIRI